MVFFFKIGDSVSVRVRRSMPALGTVTATWLIVGRNGQQAALGFAVYTGSLTFLRVTFTFHLVF